MTDVARDIAETVEWKLDWIEASCINRPLSGTVRADDRQNVLQDHDWCEPTPSKMKYLAMFFVQYEYALIHLEEMMEELEENLKVRSATLEAKDEVLAAQA